MRIHHDAVENETNIQGEFVEARLSSHADAVLHFMSILINQYSDTTLAVVREYFCNGYDATIEAGSTKPVEVTLPTALNPTLRFRDYGVGLSADQILPVFFTFGESTKKDDDDQIGGFGIGSKAAFTIANEFTVSSVKDGQRVVVIFSLNERGVPGYRIVHESETTEPNGVEVAIPVDDFDRVATTAAEFFRYVDPGTVLVNGVAPISVLDQGVQAGSLRFQQSGRMVARVGQVAYELPQWLINRALGDYSLSSVRGLIVDLPIGSVDIAPSRESLRDSKRTLAALKAALTEGVDILTAQGEEEVKNAASFAEAAKVLREYKVNAPFLNLEPVWNGVKIARTDIANQRCHYLYTSRRAIHARLETATYYRAEPLEIDGVLIITDVDNGAAVTRIAKRYLENNEEGHTTLIPVDTSSFAHEWFTTDVIDHMTLDEFREINKQWAPSKQIGAGAKEAKYSLGFSADNDREYRSTVGDITANAVDDEVLVFECAPASQYRFLLRGRTVVTLTNSQSMARAQSNFGGFYVDGKTALREAAAEYVKGELTTSVKKSIAFRNYWNANRYEAQAWVKMGRLLSRAAVPLQNEEILRHVRTAQAIVRKADAIKDNMTQVEYAAQVIGAQIDLPGVDQEVASTDKFPMVKAAMRISQGYGEPEHDVINEVVTYLNLRVAA